MTPFDLVFEVALAAGRVELRSSGGGVSATVHVSQSGRDGFFWDPSGAPRALEVAAQRAGLTFDDPASERAARAAIEARGVLLSRVWAAATKIGKPSFAVAWGSRHYSATLWCGEERAAAIDPDPVIALGLALVAARRGEWEERVPGLRRGERWLGFRHAGRWRS